MTDKESAIYATGYWNGIAYKNQQQTKPLTDEEIKTIIVQHIQTWNSLDSIIEFARAIEERHGIK
jgi:hypothetical protein